MASFHFYAWASTVLFRQNGAIFIEIGNKCILNIFHLRIQTFFIELARDVMEHGESEQHYCCTTLTDTTPEPKFWKVFAHKRLL